MDKIYPPPPPGAPLICMAASGGGHLHQVLDLKPLWRTYPHFLVTEDLALARSVAERVDTEFVPHFALGQARLGSPIKMMAAAWRSLWRSLAIVWRRRPDVVISTGAGSMVFILFWARLLGARIVIIDSIARFDGPSGFAKLAGPLAHKRYAQSAGSAENWRNAIVHNPLRALDTIAPQKDKLLFATVGATLPFDRLSQLVVDAKRKGLITHEVVLQVGKGAAPIEPVAGLHVVEDLPYAEIQALLLRADIVVSHGGTGSILTALKRHCRVIVIPRLFELGEHYDNHQLEMTKAFVARGLVLCAPDEASFYRCLIEAPALTPQAMATNYSDQIASLRRYIDEGL